MDASTIPYTKGEGASLMIVNFVSADFGWLSSPDGENNQCNNFLNLGKTVTDISQMRPSTFSRNITHLQQCNYSPQAD